jgi:uncharacterized protein YjiK
VTASLIFAWPVLWTICFGAIFCGIIQSAMAQVQAVPVISTIAGSDTCGFSGDGGPSNNAMLCLSISTMGSGIAVDRQGNIYVADQINNRIRKIDKSTGIISTVAGNGSIGFSGDGGLAINAELIAPEGVAVDNAGNIYIADTYNYRIREVIASSGIITTVAGNGIEGDTGDGGNATNAAIRRPAGVAVDSSGNIYIVCGTMGVRMVDAATGLISTVTNTTIDADSVAVDSSGLLYIASSYNYNTVYKVDPSSGSIVTVAGNGAVGYNGDGILATNAELYSPYGLAVDSTGNVLIADKDSNRIREVNAANGLITTVAGSGPVGSGSFAGDGSLATAAKLNFPTGVAIDNTGNIYIADHQNNRIRKVSTNTTLPTTSLRATSTSQVVLVQLQVASAISSISVPKAQNGAQEFAVGMVTGCTMDGVTVNPASTVCTVPVTFAPQYPGLRTGALTVNNGATFVGTVGLNGMGTGPQVAFTPGTITTVAGNGTYGSSGNGEPATSATMSYPGGVAVDSAHNLYFADIYNNVVRRVAAGTGIITTVAGGGYGGDGGPATSAELSMPGGVSVDSAGNLYIADWGNWIIRKVDASTGIISTVTKLSFPGLAAFLIPNSPTVDNAGNLYIADQYNNIILKVAAGTGTITTVAGNGTRGYSGDGGPATGAALNYPSGPAVDSAGNLYFADSSQNGPFSGYSSDNIIRKVAADTGIITTVAGNGTNGYSGDGGPATSAELYGAAEVALDSAGNLYIADAGNGVIRKVNAGTGIIATVVGSGTSSDGGDGGPATSAALTPVEFAVDGAGNLFIADSANERIRKVDVADPPTLGFATTNVGATSSDSPQTLNISNIGNQPLVFSAPTTGSNPSYPANFPVNNSDTALCASGPSLASGASCDVSMSFIPTNVGSNSGSVVLTDNALNVTGATQVIQLSGMGVGITPTITWATPASINYGTALGSTQLNANSGGVAGSFVYTPSAGTVLPVGKQALSVTFTPMDTAGYTTATGSTTITVNQATPTIAWAAPAAITYGTALNAAQLNAGSNGVAGTFAYTPALGTVLDAGKQTLSVTFTPTDSTDYLPATATVSLTVNPAAPTINWMNPAAINYGTALSGTQLNASAGSVAGSFSYSPAAGTVLTAGKQSLSVTFTPTDSTDYTAATAAVPLVVNQATPTVSWTAPAAIAYGSALSAAQLDATASVPGTFAYSPALGAVLKAGPQTLSVTFTPTDVTDYSTATATASLTVNQDSPVLSLVCTEAAYDGNSHSCTGTAAGVGGATVSGTWSMNPVSETAAGSYPVTGTFTSSDANYTNGTASGMLKIDHAMPGITWPTPTPITYGAALGAAQLDASSKVAGTFAYSPATGTVLTVGKQALSVTFTPSDTTDYAVATATKNLTVNQATPTITWPTPAAIIYGTTLSSTQLDATASVPGTFTYSPAAGTTPAVGSDQISVTFTPTDGTDYTTATATVTLVVNSPSNPTPVFGSMSPAYTTAGGASFTLTANGSGFVNGSTVYWGTTALATQFVSATQLTAQVTTAEIASAGTSTITVLSPAPGGGTSNALQFEIDSAASGTGTAPSFTSLTASVAAGSTASYPVTLPTSATNVSATCLNLPTGATCTYSSTSGAVTIATSSSTPKGTYQITVVFSETLQGAASSFVMLPLLLLPLLFIRRKMVGRGIWFTACLGLVLLAGATVAVGCGGGGGSSPVTPTNPTHQVSSSGTVGLTVQ